MINGYILLVDELDSQLHPLLTKAIIQLFNSNDVNNNCAQIICTTHDTNLLDKELFRRDQIWFTEKDRYSSTDLYSLLDYQQLGKKVRKDESDAKNYIQGKYGAIPFIGDFYNIFVDCENHE